MKEKNGKVHHTASAYLTIVALDKNGRPKEVPGLILETEDENRRNRAAAARHKARIEEKKKEDQCRQDIDSCKL